MNRKTAFLKVVLQNNITNEKYLFKCERWLSKDEQDHKIELELSVENANNETKTKQQRKQQFKILLLQNYW
jgi:hypothetical protein